jgi:hypothetical protein
MDKPQVGIRIGVIMVLPCQQARHQRDGWDAIRRDSPVIYWPVIYWAAISSTAVSMAGAPGM